MSFKLLIKQAFKNLTSKFRLYLSLIIFLIVGFSMVNGIATFINNFETNFKAILFDGEILNYQIPKKQFLDYNDKNESKNENILFKLTQQGHDELLNYMASVVSVSEEEQLAAKKFFDDKGVIAKIGLTSGNINDIEFNNFDNKSPNYVDKLQNISKYYSGNILYMFLMENFLKETDNTMAMLSSVIGEEANTKQEVLIKPIPVESNSDNIPNPFIKNDLNKLHFNEKANKKFEYSTEKYDGLTPLYVSPNYLRFTHKKVGSYITLNVNSQQIKGYIKGIASEKTEAIYESNQFGVFVDLDTLGQVTNGRYLNPISIDGYTKIENSSNSYNNENEIYIAADRMNKKIMKTSNFVFDNNTKEPLFESTANNKLNYIEPIDYQRTMIGYYHEPLNIYNAFSIFISVSLALLIIVISIFIIDESIRSEKKTLWFLKSMGENNFTLSLVNSFSVFMPLLTSIGISIPGMMIIMKFLETAVMDNYSFDVHFYSLSWFSAVIIIAFFFGTLLMFLVINIVLIKGNALSQQTTDTMSKFQIFLAKITDPMVKKGNPKFRVGFAFIRQNFAKNIVSFVLFSILFTVTLFGVQFNRSITNQKHSYQNWFGDYQTISTLSPKRVVNFENTDTTYEKISAIDLDAKRDIDKKEELKLWKDNINNQISNKYNYDIVKFLNEKVMKGIDEADGNATSKSNILKIVIDSDEKVVKSLPKSETILMSMILHMGETVDLDYMKDRGLNCELIKKYHPIENDNYPPASQFQWFLRELKDLSLWQIDGTYISSFIKIINEQYTPKQIEHLVNKANEIIDELPSFAKPMLVGIKQLVDSQRNMFNIEYPGFNINLGNIVDRSGYKNNETKAVSALGIELIEGNRKYFAYGLDSDKQPFQTPIEGLNRKTHIVRNPKDGKTYEVIDIMLSTVAKDRYRIHEGEIIPFNMSDMGIKSDNLIGFKVSGFVKNDSVILEGFYNKEAMYEVIERKISPKISIKETRDYLDNTFYSTNKIPYFVQNVTIPHIHSYGTYIDDYIYALDSFNSDHKTTEAITLAFGNMVDEYSSLMTKIIILLIVLCIALSSIMITLILFENKKIILLFKAMGYKKREVIWYLISGYLIAVVLAFAWSIVMTIILVNVLQGPIADNLFLQLIFTPFWLFFVIGIFESLGFMILVILSIVTYTRVLKPRDAFATL